MNEARADVITAFVSVEAKPGKSFESNQPIAGYYQLLGITARSQEHLISLIREHLKADLDSILIDVAEMWVPDFDGADADVKDVCGDTSKVGIWYTSGHAFHGDEEESDSKA